MEVQLRIGPEERVWTNESITKDRVGGKGFAINESKTKVRPGERGWTYESITKDRAGVNGFGPMKE